MILPECVLLSSHSLEGQLSSWSTGNSALWDNKGEDVGVATGEKKANEETNLKEVDDVLEKKNAH